MQPRRLSVRVYWHDDALASRHRRRACSTSRPPRSSRCPSSTPRTPSGSGTSAPRFATARSPSGSSGIPAATPLRDELEMLHLPAYIDSVQEFCAAGGGFLTQSTPVVGPLMGRRARRCRHRARGHRRRSRRRLRPGLCARAPAGPPRPARPGRRLLPLLERRAGGRAGAPARRRAGRRHRLGRAPRKRHAGSASGTGPTCSPSRSTCGTGRGARRTPRPARPTRSAPATARAGT